MTDPRVEGDDRIKAIVKRSIDYMAELGMMCGPADGVREDVVALVHDFLGGAICIIEEANEVYGTDGLPCAEEVRKVYGEYDELRRKLADKRRGCAKNG